MRRPAVLARVLVALVLGATGGAMASTAPAWAAACSAGSGVTVVVNSSVGCDANGGGSAASNFGDAGHTLTRTRKFPGFVCRVDGAPASDKCLTASPANAYWGLFWSDGKSGKWVYSNVGVDSLNVPAGGWVAFKFQSSNSTSYPTVSPVTKAAAQPKPKPTRAAPPAATTAPKSGASATPKAKAEATKKAKAKAEAKAKAKAEKSTGASASPSASASAQAARSAELEQASQETEGPSSTLWAGGLLALALVVGMAVTIWQRRSRQA